MGKARKFLGYNNAERHQEQRGLNRNLNTFSLPQSNPRPSQTAKPDSLYMKRSGGQFTGPFGSTDLTRTISTGKLNIGSSDGAALDSLPMHRRYFLDPEGAGTTDTLDMIDADGKEMDGMEIILMGIGSNVITITHDSGSASGNNRAIICPGNANYTLSNESAVYLIYDSGNTQWIVVGAASNSLSDGDTKIVVTDATPDIEFYLNNTLTAEFNLDGSLNPRLLFNNANSAYLDMGSATISNVQFLTGSKGTAQHIQEKTTGWDIKIDSANVFQVIDSSSIFSVQAKKAQMEDEGVYYALSGFNAFMTGSTAPTTMSNATNVGALGAPYVASTDSGPSATTLNNWFGDQNGCIGLQYCSSCGAGTNYVLWAKLNGGWQRIAQL